MQTSGEGDPAGGVAAPHQAPEAGTQDVAGQAQQMAAQVADQAQAKTGQVAQQIKQQASSRLSGQIDRAAEGLGNLSQALLSVSGQLRQQDRARRRDAAQPTGAVAGAHSQVPGAHAPSAGRPATTRRLPLGATRSRSGQGWAIRRRVGAEEVTLTKEVVVRERVVLSRRAEADLGGTRGSKPTEEPGQRRRD
jgi:hypothetical protein